MAVIYLRHPVHGEKVACSDFEAAEDRKNGWEDFDPTKRGKAEAAPAAPVTPEVVENNPPGFEAEDAATKAVPPAPTTPPVVENPPAEVPSFLAPTSDVPSFLTGTPTPPAPEQAVSDLPEDFPGRDLLIESGYVTWESVVDLNREQLIDIKGIGPKTADAILEKMNG